MDERRIGLGEVIRTLDRVDKRTARIEDALFEEHGLIWRVAELERRDDREDAEKREHRIIAGIATFTGSVIGALASYFGSHR